MYIYWTGPGVMAVLPMIIIGPILGVLAVNELGWQVHNALMGTACVVSLVASVIGFLSDRLPRGSQISCYFRAAGSAWQPKNGRIALSCSIPTAGLPFVVSIICALFVFGWAWFGEGTWTMARDVGAWASATIGVASMLALLTVPLRTLPDQVTDINEEIGLEAGDGTACPGCGFGYGWNGACCGHCGHRAAP